MFRDNLKDQIEYKGMKIKELSAKSGVSKRTIDTYVDSRAVIPNAEIAVKLAKALDTTVEFLVTGIEPLVKEKSLEKEWDDILQLRKYRKVISDFDVLSLDMQECIASMIHTAAKLMEKNDKVIEDTCKRL
ncbi:MAG: helix-turn-helix transcriptional regulator [Spirochaetaceae bacterium]|nr:helix-turn-helix transcriptional regulator [Spirochaetaceae bacterium]